MESARPDRFYIADWLVEPSLNRISRAGEEQSLDPRMMEVLTCLADRCGKVVRREELLDRVWRDVIVSENTISSVVARLRKILGDDWQNPRFIETISKSGYRLVAPVGADEAPPRLSLVREGGEPVEPRGPQQSNAKVSRHGVARLAIGFGGVALAAGVWFSGLILQEPARFLESRPLLTLPGQEHGAVLSPNGIHVAFAWQAEADEQPDVYVQRVGDPNPIQFTQAPGPEGFPTWSPDGLELAYAAANPQTLECAYYRKPLIGGQRIRLAACGMGVRGLDWASDGSALIISENPSPTAPAQLYRVALDGSGKESLLEPAAAGRGDWDPEVSPDGGSVAFRRWRPTRGADLFVLPLGEGTAIQLTSDAAAHVRGVTWDRNGKDILFSSNRDGRYRLWRVAATGGEPVREPISDHTMAGLHQARGAKRLIFRSIRDETNFLVVDVDSRITGPRPVLSSTREELFPSFSPDGSRLAFVSRRTGHYEVWSGALDGTALIQHTAFQGPQVGPPRWSPDGEYIVFDASPTGQSDLYVVDTEGQTPRRLTTHSADEVNARFGDGGKIYFSSNRTGIWEIWSMDGQDGAPTQVTEGGGYDAQEFEGALWFTRVDSAGIRRQLPGSRPELVVADIGLTAWGSWSVRSNGVYYVAGSSRAVVLQPHDGSEPKRLFEPTKGIPGIGPALAVSPDQDRIVLAQIESMEDDVMIVER